MTDTQVCTQCKIDKPTDEYYLTPGGKPRGECKTCIVGRVVERHREVMPDGRTRGAHRSQKRREKAKREAIEAYGGRCQCCLVEELVFLTIDHVDGGGRQDRETKRGSGVFYRWLRDQGWPDGFQVLCWNCNSAKHILGVCPHQSAESR